MAAKKKKAHGLPENVYVQWQEDGGDSRAYLIAHRNAEGAEEVTDSGDGNVGVYQLVRVVRLEKTVTVKEVEV